MASEEHLYTLEQGAAVWNAWRSQKADVEPDLSEPLDGQQRPGSNRRALGLVRAFRDRHEGAHGERLLMPT